MTALWFISAVYATQIPKNGSFKPFLGISGIVTMRIFIDACTALIEGARTFANPCKKACT